jgi:hypothetical protein
VNYQTNRFKVLCLLFAAALGITAAPSSHAQPLKDVIDALLSKTLGDKATQLQSVLTAATKGKNLLPGRTWTFKDAGLADAKVTAFATEVCVEKLRTKNIVCSNYQGIETRRTGYALMPNGTGESAKIYVEGGRIVVHSERVDCTTGLQLVWAVSESLLSTNQQPITSTVLSTGGLGGCS